MNYSIKLGSALRDRLTTGSLQRAAQSPTKSNPALKMRRLGHGQFTEYASPANTGASLKVAATVG